MVGGRGVSESRCELIGVLRGDRLRAGRDCCVQTGHMGNTFAKHIGNTFGRPGKFGFR